MCSCIWPMASRILSFKALVVSGLSAYHLTLTASHKVQRCKKSWPNDISSAADNAIFKNRAKTSSVASARSAVLLKPNVANILLFNFCEKNSFNMASHCSFSKKNVPIMPSGPKFAPNSDSFWVRRLIKWGSIKARWFWLQSKIHHQLRIFNASA